MNKHSSDKPSPGIQIQNQHVESIFSLARHSRVEEVDRLLVQGVDVNIRDENGNTILCIASQNGNKKMAKLALRWGCDINARNLKGNSPLHFCYQYGYRSLGEYLISKGANPNIKNVEGYTCFDLGGLGE
jgi:ankyrin repeat protein